MNGGREKATLIIANKSQIEHIMPKKIMGSAWETEIKAKQGFTTEVEIDEYKKMHLDKLGNLTLLNNIKNVKNSNKSFEDKKNTFVDSQEIKMTQDLVEYPVWDDESILTRQESFIVHAQIIWNLKNS